MDTFEKQSLIANVVSSLSSAESALHQMALDDGGVDEVCPRPDCEKVFLAHRNNSLVENCDHHPCIFSLPESEHKSLLASANQSADPDQLQL